MFSRVVRRPYPLVSPPLTMLIRSRIGNGSVETSWPATHACPQVGRSRVHRILISVVFPAPFGPRRPNSSPSRIWVVTFSRAVTGPSGAPFPLGFFRLNNLREGLNILKRSFVSIAKSIVFALAGEPAGQSPGRPEAGWGDQTVGRSWRYRVRYPAIRFRIRGYATSVSSDTFFL